MIIIRKNKLFILVIIQIFVFLLLITNTYATDIAVSTELTENPINQHTVSEVNEKFNSNNFLINDLDTRFYLFNRKIGADIAKKKYGVSKEIQEAIEYHTTTNPNMTNLDKIVFVADKIELNRK